MNRETPDKPDGRAAGSARLAILLSGRGSNFLALARAVESESIPDAGIVAVVSDRGDAKGLEAARAMGIPAFAIERKRFGSRDEHEEEILRVLREARPDLICLAGYMRLLSPRFVRAYAGRILNIHPSLLPKFPGLQAQRRAIEAGEKESGCTAHFVEDGTDSGPILVQKKVRVMPGDTPEALAARILEREHEAYPEAVNIALSRLRGSR